MGDCVLSHLEETLSAYGVIDISRRESFAELSLAFNVHTFDINSMILLELNLYMTLKKLYKVINGRPRN